LATAPAVNLNGAVRWSDPATWGGKLPPAGAEVVIPSGKVVLLDVSATVGKLRVDGTLACDPNKDASLQTSGITVRGTFACGSQFAPFLKRLTITMTSGPSDAMEANAIMVMDGGLLALFGEPRRGWTQLAKTAKANDTTISLVDQIGLRVGDRIVLASTDFDPNQAEEAGVSAVSGSSVTLDRPLRWMHWGALQTFPNDVEGAPTVLDARGEVGLLSRNIVVEGAAAAKDTGFGAHVMAMAGGRMYVRGVELRRVGQKSRSGRYPLHWHLANDVQGQFIADTSIHQSFNRCITIHGTQNATVLRNFCFDHIGHGYFLEDGVETGNVLAFNVGVKTRTALPGEEVLRSDRVDLGISMVGRAAGPSTFWVSNGDNVLLGNRAAGSDGSGFWYPPKKTATGASAGLAGYEPRRFPIRQFSGNTAHSSEIGLLLGFDVEQPGVPAEEWYLGPRAGTAIVQDFTSYKIHGMTGGQAGNIWLRGGAPVVFRNIVTADSRHHYNLAFDASLDGALMVGQSANVGNPVTAAEKTAGRTLPWHEQVGFGLYDGPHDLKRAHFTGFNPNPYGPDPAALATTAAIVQVDGAHSSPAHSMRDISVASSSVKFSFGQAAGNNVSILDVDGRLSGHAGWYITGKNPLMFDGRCMQLQTGPNPVYACPGPEINVRLHIAPGGGAVPNGSTPGDATLTRSDGAQVTLGGFNKNGGSVMYYESNVLAGYDYSYSFPNVDRMPQVLELRMLNPAAKKGQALQIAVPMPWADIYVERAGVRLQPAANVGALNGAQSGYTVSSPGRYTFRLVFQSDGGTETLRICRNVGCR
jgi:cell migration-inducing and hyaluronan-binding protein